MITAMGAVGGAADTVAVVSVHFSTKALNSTGSMRSANDCAVLTCPAAVRPEAVGARFDAFVEATAGTLARCEAPAARFSRAFGVDLMPFVALDEEPISVVYRVQALNIPVEILESRIK